MPGKRATRLFSRLSEFERGLIIGMKTASWSTRRVAGQVDRSECAVRNCWEQWTRKSTHAWKTGSGANRKTTRNEVRRIVWQALVDPTVTRSTLRAHVGVAIVRQTISRHLAEANLKSSGVSAHSPFYRNIGNCVYSVAKPDQCGMSQIGIRLCLVMNPGLFWGQMITLYGCGGALLSGPFLNGLPGAIFQQDNARPHTASVAQDFLRHFQTLPWPTRSPNLSPVVHAWDQLKPQMPSCHSLHDLELAVQYLCSQLASVDKNNALREIKLRLSYLQGKSTTMSVIAHQTEKEWISANEKSRQRMSQAQAEGAAKQHAARLEEAHLRAHLCQT
ncbi:transposable element Tcb2 transposase [Trichonephila clavipes]|nr:transposable element Tcb2 transposase [Trichonephila clavipes]